MHDHVTSAESHESSNSFEIAIIGFDLVVTKVPLQVAGDGSIAFSAEGLTVEGQASARWLPWTALASVMLGLYLTVKFNDPMLAVFGVMAGALFGALLRIPGRARFKHTYPWDKVRKLRLVRLGHIAAAMRVESSDAVAIWVEVKQGINWRYLHALPRASDLPALASAFNDESEDKVQLDERQITSTTVDETGKGVAGRWVRLVARIFDLWIASLVVQFVLGFIVGLFMPQILPSLVSFYGVIISSIVIVPLALGFDALVYRAFGKTPGKAILGVSVVTAEGAPLTPKAYMRRNLSVWLFGLGLNIPLVNLFAMGRQFNRLGEGAPTSYDEPNGWTVLAEKTASARIVTLLAVWMVVWLGNAWLNASLMQGNATSGIKTDFAASSQQSSNQAVQQLKNEVQAIQDQIPLMISQELRLDMANLLGKTFRYQYAFHQVPPLEFNENGFRSQMLPSVREQVCSNNLRQAIEAGYGFHYVYTDNRGELLGEIKLTKEDCK